MALVVGVAEDLSNRLRHSGDDCDDRAVESPNLEFFWRAVVEPAEKPILPTPGTRNADFVVAAHRAVHGLPFTAPAERWRGRGSHGLKDGEHRCFNSARTCVEEVFGRHDASRGLVVDDAPVHAVSVCDRVDALNWL